MHYLYYIVSSKTSYLYIGITNNMKRRFACHRHAAKSGKSSRLYNTMRKYGIDNFFMVLVESFDTKEDCQKAEIAKITFARENGWKILNVADGGEGGYVVPDHLKGEWKAKLSRAQSNRIKQPALGMKHTDETKKLCGEFGKKRWDIYGRYPVEVTQYAFKEAKDKYNISKTHYYRLLKRAKSNDLS